MSRLQVFGTNKMGRFMLVVFVSAVCSVITGFAVRNYTTWEMIKNQAISLEGALQMQIGFMECGIALEKAGSMSSPPETVWTLRVADLKKEYTTVRSISTSLWLMPLYERLSFSSDYPMNFYFKESILYSTWQGSVWKVIGPPFQIKECEWPDGLYVP